MSLYRHLLTGGALGAFALVSACSEQATSPDGPGIAIKIAPVTYNAAVDVCYGIHIANADGDTVVFLQNICSSDYGNGAGGDIAYVAPCDASGTGSSTVTLWLEEIVVDPGTGPEAEDEDSYINPCGLADLSLDTDNTAGADFPVGDLNYDAPFTCTRTVTCLPNADVQVAFNLTIMRDAQQGFFDIIVDFEDIFCSAKIDTCYRADEDHEDPWPIKLLLDLDEGQSDGSRDATAVMAFACTAGADETSDGDEEQTTLHLSKVNVDCAAGVSFSLDPTGPGKNKTVVVGTNTINYALYVGDEVLPCDSDEGGPIPCNKAWWNLALNLEDLQEAGFANCTISATGTATGADGVQLVDGQLDGIGVSYAAINFSMQVNGTGGAPVCDYNPLNGENSAGDDSTVTTGYYGTGDIEGLVNFQMCYSKATGANGVDNGDCE